VTEIQALLPETPWQREQRYRELGLDARTARQLAHSWWAHLFDELQPPAGDVAHRVATALERRLPYHRRKGRLNSVRPATRLAPLVHALESGELRLEATDRVLDMLLERRDISAVEVLQQYYARLLEPAQLQQLIAQVISDAEELKGKPFDVVARWATGRVIPRFLGRLEPNTLLEQLLAALREKVVEVGT
jgi:Glu-tRNA(Gln) amidotransferase subunit E-like FAD-binding protein